MERVRQQYERYLADHPRAKVTTAEKAVRGVALILDIDLKLLEQPSVAGEVLIL